MDPPGQLEFFSWWYEETHRQHLRLCYDISSKELRVKINESEEEHVLSRVMTMQGKEVEVRINQIWDLFVGAEIEVFGKKTVLKQCDQHTAVWIARQAQELGNAKLQLETALRKYDTSKLPYSILRTPVHFAQNSASIRDYVTQVRWLKEKLAGYRPRVASKLTAHLKDI